MKTLMWWVMQSPGEWKRFIYEWSDANCAIVEASFRRIYPQFPEEFIERDYVQLIYEIGGGIEMFFISCH